MPDIALHRQMGVNVAEKLPENIVLEKEVFLYATSGPDSWSCYRFYWIPAWRKYHSRSKTMHEQKTGAFLTALAQAAQRNTGKVRKELLSYAAGFICHYALDSATHPYIDSIAAGTLYGHALIERELERRLLRREGYSDKRPISRMLTLRRLPETMKNGLCEAYNVYAWDNIWNDLNQAVSDMRRYYWLMEDPHGVVAQLFGWSGRLRSCSYQYISYQEADLLNIARKPWRAQENTTFDELVERAIEQAIDWICLLHSYVYEDAASFQSCDWPCLTGGKQG